MKDEGEVLVTQVASSRADFMSAIFGPGRCKTGPTGGGLFWASLVWICLTSSGVVHAKENSIQCANLIYAGNHTSRCFSDAFLTAVQKDTDIATERRFKSVKLDSDELFNYPFVIMTGESDFHFTAHERENMKRYLTSGGFLLASAGCSNKEWDRAFRREMKLMFGDQGLKKIDMTHPVFRTVHPIKALKLSHPGEDARLEGLEQNGKLVALYSPHGLNETAHTEGCCCCGGNEIQNCIEVNINILVYALLH